MEIITTLASSLSCAAGTDSRSSHNSKWDAEHNNLLVNHVILLFKRFLYINRTASGKIKLIFAKTLLKVH